MNKKIEEAANQHLIDTDSYKYNMPSTIEFQLRAFKAAARWVSEQFAQRLEDAGELEWADELRALIADEEKSG